MQVLELRNLKVTPELMRAVLDVIGCYDVHINGDFKETLQLTLSYLWTLEDGEEWPLTVQFIGRPHSLGCFVRSVERVLAKQAAIVEMSRRIHAAAPEIPAAMAEEVLQAEQKIRDDWYDNVDDDFDELPF